MEVFTPLSPPFLPAASLRAEDAERVFLLLRPPVFAVRLPRCRSHAFCGAAVGVVARVLRRARGATPRTTRQRVFRAALRRAMDIAPSLFRYGVALC